MIAGLMPMGNCPVCGSAERITACDGMAAGRKDMGLHYVKHAAAQLNMGVEALVDAAQVYQCPTCDTYYCDPWLAPETAAYIFTTGAPDHVAGWGNFEHWLSSGHPGSVEARNRKLYRIVTQRIGAIASYAEFGCPFQGFLLMFEAQKKMPAERTASFAQAMQREVDVRWTLGTRLHHRASRWANCLVIGYHRLRAFKELGRSGQFVPEEKFPAVPAIRRLLTQDSVRAWGNNCVRYGGSCRYYASTVLGADVLPFGDTADAVRADRMDLLGIFNGLDHTSDPVRVIRNGLKLARHIVVATHHAAYAGKQHQYAFGEKFPQWLNTVLENARAQDITGEMIGNIRRDINYMLISSVEK